MSLYIFPICLGPIYIFSLFILKLCRWIPSLLTLLLCLVNAILLAIFKTFFGWIISSKYFVGVLLEICSTLVQTKFRGKTVAEVLISHSDSTYHIIVKKLRLIILKATISAVQQLYTYVTRTGQVNYISDSDCKLTFRDFQNAVSW